MFATNLPLLPVGMISVAKGRLGALAFGGVAKRVQTTVRRGLASRDGPGRQRFDERAYLSGLRQPYLIAFVHDVAHGSAKFAQAKWLSDAERVQGDSTDQGLVRRLFEHLVEVSDDHVSEFRCRVLVEDDRPVVVELYGIGHCQDRPSACLEPDRLVVTGPVRHVAVTVFLQQIQRDVAFGKPRAHPSHWDRAFVSLDDLGRGFDQLSFVLFGQDSLFYRVCDAMPKDFVAPFSQAVDYLRTVVVHGRVELRLNGYVQVVEHVHQAPETDTVAVVPPREHALWRMLSRGCDGRLFTLAP